MNISEIIIHDMEIEYPALKLDRNWKALIQYIDVLQQQIDELGELINKME